MLQGAQRPLLRITCEGTSGWGVSARLQAPPLEGVTPAVAGLLCLAHGVAGGNRLLTHILGGVSHFPGLPVVEIHSGQLQAFSR